MKMERLDKILSGSGLYTRSQARTVIQAGRVTVDATPVRRPEAKVSRGAVIQAEGRTVDTAEFVYYMMNKPAGTVCATEDDRMYPAVTGLLPKDLQNRGLFPVGRLDADVTGLLLLTDDGAFAHRVTAPRSEIPKTYEVDVDAALSAEDAAALAAGVTMPDGTAYRPALLVLDDARPCRGLVTVTEGKYHEVKNLMASRGRTVVAMRRLSIGALRLDGTVEPGQIRRLTDEEAALCFQSEPGEI